MKINLTLLFALLNGASFGQMENKEFIAMEYRGMSNLIYRIVVIEDKVIGVKVSGYISVANPMGIGRSVASESLNDPTAYIDEKMEAKYRGANFASDSIVTLDNENFIIRKGDISKCYHNPNKKWGMGYYPHNGRIMIETIKTSTNKRKNRDLILVGYQDEKEILELLR